MASIGFVMHTEREAARRLAAETAAWLTARGHHPRELGAGLPPDWAAYPSESLGDVDLAVSLGGDGTMLRTVDLVTSSGVPVLGINLGHLGYLTTVEPEDLCAALEQFLAGSYQVEHRMTLDVEVRGELRDDRVRMHRTALNDVVLQRPASAHTVRAELSVNDAPFLTFAADSIIVATPTGSTAYNLSARGPIVSPRARVQILTPVAPHMLFDRSLVLDADESLSIIPIGEQPVDVVVDGWHATTLRPGQTLHCSHGAHDALLVTFGERNFHRILKNKFDLKDR